MLNRFAPAVCLVALGLLLPLNALKRAAGTPQVTTPPMDVLYAAPGNLNYAYGPKGRALQALTAGDRPASATITVTYNGFSPEAQAAFEAAVNIWRNTITSAAPIRILANWTPLASNVLGSAGASRGCDVSGGVPNTRYAAALADKINGSPFCASFPTVLPSEIVAFFNSSFSPWDFGTTGAGVPDQYNFMTVVLHEIGHGLGFFGRFTSSGGIGDLGSDLPYIYDRFAVTGTNATLLGIARPSAALHAQLTGNNTFWNNSTYGLKLETHDMFTQYGSAGADNGWLPGSSYSHLDDVQYSGTPNGLMTFRLAGNEVYTAVGPIVRTIFADEGWTFSTPVVRTAGDFSGDGRADFAVFQPSSGMWLVQGQPFIQWGAPGDIPVPGDYNNDGITDRAVFRPSNGTWYEQVIPAAVQWGRSGDIPVPGDYNGDGLTDLAVFRTSDGGGGTWFIRNIGTFSLGTRGDIPVPADYDGDGRTDMAVFRPATGIWYFLNSTTGLGSSLAFGLPGDIPIGARFDTDSRADFAVYRPSTGTWYLLTTAAGTFTIPFGLTGDVPLAQDTDFDGIAELNVWRPATGTWYTYNRVTAATASAVQGDVGDIPVMQRPRVPSAPAADFDGDGRAELTVYRVVGAAAYWFQRFSRTAYATNATTQFGLSGDLKVAGDYDGDHKADVAVFRPGSAVWFLTQSATASSTQVQFGLTGDVPVPGDYDGDGRTDPAVYRPSNGYWFALLSSTKYGSVVSGQWGVSGDVPVVGDFDGDGKTDFAVFRPANGTWYLKMTTTLFGPSGMAAKQYGLSSDIPVAADYDGDGRTDLGLFRGQGTWLAADALTNQTLPARQLGLSSDLAIPHDYDGDGSADIAVFRPSTGQWFFTQSSNGAVRTFQWGLNGDQPVLRADPWR